MSLTTFDATPQKPDASIKGSESANSALAQALSGEVFSNKESTLSSFVKGGTQALQQTLDRSAKDMETTGKLPEREKVADLSTATHEDKHSDFAAKMSQDDIVDEAAGNALKHVEKT